MKKIINNKILYIIAILFSLPSKNSYSYDPAYTAEYNGPDGIGSSWQKMLNQDCTKTFLGKIKTLTIGGDKEFWDYIGVSITGWQNEGEVLKPEEYCYIQIQDDNERLEKCLNYINSQNEWAERCSRYSLKMEMQHINNKK